MNSEADPQYPLGTVIGRTESDQHTAADPDPRRGLGSYAKSLGQNGWLSPGWARRFAGHPCQTGRGTGDRSRSLNSWTDGSGGGMMRGQ